MGDVSGEDDGSRLFGGFVLGINLIAAYAALFAHRSVLILPALYSFTGIIFWGGYSVEHLGRWMAGGGGNPLLLVPEAMSVASVGSVVALAGAMITIHSAEARRPRRNAARWG